MLFETNYLFQGKIKYKVHSIFPLFYFLNNQQPIKIDFTSCYKTYFKNNTKNYVTNYYVLLPSSLYINTFFLEAKSGYI